ncbi:hypothetical protein VNI00_008989 [Paramarasmius palmivorus]|uniref:CENP-V/GFA domain-containing protein n=1 Tax=Paramarasmius palmivorus TaxID=297713 RepID=A0AAW0CSR3_9AGAR
MFWTKKGRERVSVFTGTLDNIAVSGEEILVRFESCIYVGDTLDGGASLWLQKCNADGSEVKRYLEGPDSGEITGSFVSEEKQAMPSVPIQCHCKGVDFVLRKGDYETKSKEELPWFVDPTTRKYIASFDACDTCRLSSGVDLFNWTFAELENITLSSDLKVSTTKELRKLVDDKNPAVGTLAYYASSPDVQRYFCSKCSACVFYAADDRPDIVDVAIGLLVADGARAEGFLSWNRDKVGWSQDVKGGWREAS